MSSATSSLVLTHSLIGEVTVIGDRAYNLENTVVLLVSAQLNPWASIRKVRVPERLVICLRKEGLKEGCLSRQRKT